MISTFGSPGAGGGVGLAIGVGSGVGVAGAYCAKLLSDAGADV